MVGADKKSEVKKPRGRRPKKLQENTPGEQLENVKSDVSTNENTIIKKKRGRKPKKKPEDSEATEVKIPKKRGRKPKGGKIVTTTEKNDSDNNTVPNIILHLKCKKK